MEEDAHFGTGTYQPERYWEARARAARGDVFQAVCAFGRSGTENAAMHRVQAAVFTAMLRGIDLRGAAVMELGCGVGRWAPLILRRGAVYWGADISETMLATARARVPDGRFFHLDADRLPFADDSLDLTFSITVLHHNPYERQERLVDELVRVTRRGRFVFLLEDVMPDARARPYFNTYTRPPQDWISDVVRSGRAELVRVQFIRYWILRDVVKRLLGPRGAATRNARLRTFLTLVGTSVDPYLLRFITPRRAGSVAMLFRKTREQT